MCSFMHYLSGILKENPWVYDLLNSKQLSMYKLSSFMVNDYTKWMKSQTRLGDSGSVTDSSLSSPFTLFWNTVT